MLVELAESDDAWLRDLRAASTRCLALLSTADALKPRLADAGRVAPALPRWCAPSLERILGVITCAVAQGKRMATSGFRACCAEQLRPVDTTCLTLLLH